MTVTNTATQTTHHRVGCISAFHKCATRRHKVAAQAFDDRPLKVESRRVGRLYDIDFLPRRIAHIADKGSIADRIVRHPMRAAQTDAVELFQDIRFAHKGIVIGDEITGCLSVCGLARDGVADVAAALIDVDSQQSPEQIVIDALRVAAVFIIADGQIEHAVDGMEKHTAAFMPDDMGFLVNEDNFGIGDCNAVGIECEARKPVVVGLVGAGPLVGITVYRPRRNPRIPEEYVMIGREIRMKRQAEETRIIPTLTLAADVKDELFL